MTRRRRQLLCRAYLSRVYRILGLVCLLLSNTCAHAKVILELKDDTLHALVIRYVSLFSADHENSLETFSPSETSVEIAQTQKEISALLNTEGYFSPQFAFKKSSEGTIEAIEVTPGPRTLVGQVDITFMGGVLPPEFDARREALREGWLLPAHHPFRQEDWARAKQTLINTLSNQDFAAARIVYSRAQIDPASLRAHLEVTIDSGPVFHLGELKIEGLKDYSPELIERFNTLKPGDTYNQDKLLALQTALQQTPYFGGVTVDIERDPTLAAAAPVKIRVTEALPQHLSFSAGVSSNTGYRAEGNYRHANVFGKGWESVTGLRVEQHGYAAFSDLILPPSEAGHRTSIGTQIERNTSQGLTISNKAIGTTRTWPTEGGERQATLKWQNEKLQPDGAPVQSLQALTLDFTRIWRWVDNPLDPHQGRVWSLKVGGGSRALVSDQNFVRVSGRWSEYIPMGQLDTLQLRAEYGTTFSRSRNGIPQDFLFRTGGTQSVRGYAYQGLGVAEGNATVGGRYMGTASAEYTHWLAAHPDWGVASFVDAGNAKDSPQFRWEPGYGMGGRWKSPVGPLAVDLAWGQADRKLRLHFAVMIAF